MIKSKKNNYEHDKRFKATQDKSTFSDSLYLSGIGDSQLYGDYEEDIDEVEEKHNFPKEMIEEYLNRVRKK